MLDDPRRPLLHDWEQGNYIEGGVLDGRIDWDGLAEMEATARSVIEWFAAEFDSCLFWSGGIDSLVLKHMVYDLGLQDTFPAVTFRTPEHYAASVAYVQEMSDRWGFRLENIVAEEMDIEWVAQRPDARLFPRWETKNEYYNAAYLAEHDLDFALAGLRQEHARSTDYIETRHGFTCGKPIYKWSFAHVIAYCDKYSLPIPEGYRVLTNGANHPWHRELTSDPRHEKTRSIPECWYLVREATVRHGYTSFWVDRILSHFPDGEDKAAGGTRHAGRRGRRPRTDDGARARAGRRERHGDLRGRRAGRVLPE
jgi:hypothetical protein